MDRHSPWRLASLFLIALSLSACGSDSSSSENAGAAQDLSGIKFPAAVVFEGGKGNSLPAADGMEQNPAWRLYICLQETNAETQGEAELDFTQPGLPTVELTEHSAVTDAVLYKRRLRKITWKYSYTANLEKSYGNATGRTELKMESAQIWDTTDEAESKRQPALDLSIFNASADHGSLFDSTNFAYSLNGMPHYISRRMMYFASSGRDGIFRPIQTCEREGKPYVLQIGDQIK